MTISTTSEAFFEDKYRQAADPWAFADSAYEQGRYAAILAELAGRRYMRAFEPGCSIGVLTELLATICDRVEAMDISSTAVARTRDRCQRLPHVAVTHGALPQDIPAGSFDLIVFSEIGYYFEPAALKQICQRLVLSMTDNATLLGVHWLGTSPDHILSGDHVHDIIHTVPELQSVDLQRQDAFRGGFRMDQWQRT